MILDITAIRDYQNTDNLQKLAMNINMENVILLLDDSPETDSKTYLSKLISLGIYNFTKNAEGINYLLVHPHTYRDVVNIHNIQDLEPMQTTNAVDLGLGGNGRCQIIGFKDMTPHAGATSLVYMMKKALASSRSVTAIEVNRVDFLYFNDKELVSTTSAEFLKEIMKRQANDVILVDLNDCKDVDVCTKVFYLVEPSTIMINKMIRKNRDVLNFLKDKNVVLNKCNLSSEDVATFEYETKLKVFASIPNVDDRQENIESIKRFISKIGL